MSNLAVLIWAFFSFTFTGNNCQVIENEPIITEITSRNNNFNNLHRLEDIVIKDPYKLTLKLKKGKNESLDLIVNIELKEGAFFASTFERERAKGHFRITLGEEDNLSMTDLLTENPISEPSLYGFSVLPMRWVTENTTYTQNLKLHTDKDFEVFGNIKFVIEPRCTLEEISFKIVIKDGKIELYRNPDC